MSQDNVANIDKMVETSSQENEVIRKKPPRLERMLKICTIKIMVKI